MGGISTEADAAPLPVGPSGYPRSAWCVGERMAAAALEGSLQAISALDGGVHAFVRLAQPARLQTATGDGLALLGWPIAIKDTIATQGIATAYGLSDAADWTPSQDAACVGLLKAAGALIVGKTVTTELAYLHPGATRNPWDLRRTPGGSSSGSAAAVAAGMVPLALGTQTGGSVIRPASYCGVFGFKASVARCDLSGVQELARSLDTLGWFAGSMADLAMLGRVLLRPARRRPALCGHPRLARLHTPFDNRVTPEAQAVIADLCRSLTARGVEVEDVILPAVFAGTEALHERIVSVEAASALAAYRGRISPALESFLARGRTQAARHDAALAQMAKLRAEFHRIVDGFDALLLPAATGAAPLGLASTGDPVMSLPFSLMGAPCATLPAGHVADPSRADGLPLGLQLVGRAGEDEALLAVAAWCCEMLGVQPRFAPDGAAMPAWARGLSTARCNEDEVAHA